ncbi:hypothetical protein IIE18_16230 [Pseudomonas sp. V1]|uniref:hypothetical protein n=1 Tax=Pseudomonas arcuscaelestis TaxID=2710591 RepID=UPI00193F30A8|nr:hypothetical protein [Pseudomonas arcuscaelestis]MBM3106678.1 hypothetical protein [Pseudomonas arcuscaelestis]
MRAVSVAFGVSLVALMFFVEHLKLRVRVFPALLIFFVLAVFGLGNSIWSEGRSVFTVFVALAAFGMAWSVLYFKTTLLFFELPFYMFLAFTLSLILMGYGPSEFNSVLQGYSRNGYSAVLLIFAVGYMFSRHYSGKSISLCLMAVVVLCSIPLYGRTGIAMATALFLVALWSRSKFMALGLGLLGLAVIVIFSSEIEQYITTRTNFSSGVDSPRALMWMDYLARLDFIGVAFGQDLNAVPLIAEYNGNPHNAFFLLHSYYGLGFFVLMLALCVSLVTLGLERRWLCLFLALVYLVRSFFDIIYLFGLLDYLVFPILFYCFFRGEGGISFSGRRVTRAQFN